MEKKFCTVFADLDFSLIARQKESVSVASDRLLFETILKERLEIKDRLSSNAEIVAQPSFEHDIGKS